MGKSKKETEVNPEVGITIHFGDVFIARHMAARNYVIVDLGEDNYCSASPVFEHEGKEALGMAGTTGIDDIVQIIDRWDYDRVEKAMMVYFGNKRPNKSIYNILRRNASKEPRILTS